MTAHRVIAALIVVGVLYVTVHVIAWLTDVRLIPTQQEHEPRKEDHGLNH